MAHKYVIRVTAGSSYDLATHTEVPVNSPEAVSISTDLIDAQVNVRVQNYRGLPLSSPASSPYFDAEPHATNKDTYSIALRFTPKPPPPAPGTTASQNDTDAVPQTMTANDDNNSSDPSRLGIPGSDLQWGNDFDHPIRDRLPPGFGTAMSIVKWWIDPGLDGDAYADMPYLYGAALSSFNAVHVGEGLHDPARGGLWFDEGGDDAGLETRRAVGAPADSKGRMKWALRAKDQWVWEYGRTYGVDFFNGYLDFSDFALRLPGYNLPIMKYWDGQGLRYVLRNKSTGDVYLVVLFSLYLKEDVNEDGTLKPRAFQDKLHHDADEDGQGDGNGDGSKTPEFDHEKALNEARRSLSGLHVDVEENGGAPETSTDDVD